MQSMKISVAIFSAILAMPGHRAFGQANVNENQTTFLYVDGGIGSDANSGTQPSPLKTIQAAVAMARANNARSIGTKVFINPGIYREFVNITSSYNQTSVPMTFQASQAGTTVIDGSDVLTNWSQAPSNPSIFKHSWTYKFGNCGVPSGWPSGIQAIVLRSEMIFVNDRPLTQVISSAQLRVGTFYVDESANEIQIWPDASTDMSTAVVEAAVRPQTLNVSGRTNVVLRGLVLRHAASCINRNGAVVNGSTNILLDQMQALWNNWGGLGVTYSSQITVQNSLASYNGGVGINAVSDRNALFDSNESDYNNWRGAMGALYDWGMGGTKLMLMRNTSVSNHISYRNQAQGLWFDTDNKNISIDNATLSENVLASLQLEGNEGPVSMTSSRLCSSGAGVNIINNAQLTVKNTDFYNNGGTNKLQGQFFLGGKAGGRLVKDWETGQTYHVLTTGTTLSNNTFQDAGPGQYVFATYLNGADWSVFTGSLSSNHNQWYDGATTKSFKIPNGNLVDLPGWQSDTREDLASSWAPAPSVAQSCVVPSPSYADFSVNADNRSYAMSSGKTVLTLHVNSFGDGPVALTASGLPNGVSASFTASTLTSGVMQVTLTATKAASPQTVPITVVASSGSRVHTLTVSVRVTPGS